MSEVALPTAQDWMSTNVLAFAPDQDLFEAIEQLLKNSFAAAPVVDEDRHLLGVLTEKDCLRVLSNLAYDGDVAEGGLVRDFLSVIRVICDPGMDLFSVSDLFLGTNFPLLPVVEEGVLVGVISRRDVLRGVQALRRQLDHERRKLEEAAGHQADRPRSIESLQRTAANRSKDQLIRLLRRTR